MARPATHKPMAIGCMPVGRSRRKIQLSTTAQIGIEYDSTATREVAAPSWANVEKMLKLATLRIEATNTWTQALGPLSRKLRRRTKHAANKIMPPTSALVVRIVNGGTSRSAIRMIGQVMPHTMHSAISINRALVSARAAVSRVGSGFLTECPGVALQGAFGPVRRYQSAICAPVKNATSGFLRMTSKMRRKYLSRCGAPMM